MKASAYLFNGTPCVRIGIYAVTGVLLSGKTVFPSANFGYDIYLNGLGTRFADPCKHWHITSEFTFALTLTGGIQSIEPQYQFSRNKYWNQPLYFFSEISAPPLQNPFWNSFSVGPVWVFPTDKIKRLAKPRYQRIGFIELHLNQFDAFYYNDGGPLITQSYLGDGHDRWHTGGGMLAYHPKTITGINDIEAVYHKFTGYQEDAFEVADQLHLAATPYKANVQKYYNLSDVCVKVGNTYEGWTFVTRFMNLRNLYDIQHEIHYKFSYAYHIVPYPLGLSFGGDYTTSNSNFFTTQVVYS